MSTLKHYKPNELEMALKIAMKAIDKLMDDKPKGGLIVNKDQDIEARMSYKEARVCIERIKRHYANEGAFSMGICGECTKWNTRGNSSGKFEDFGRCGDNTKHRYDCCCHHSIENGGWGL